MNVAIVTPVRDVAGQPLGHLIDRLNSLNYDHLRFVIVEGDSADNTWWELAEWAKMDNRVTLVKHDTGRPRFGHVVSVERFKHLAGIINAGVEAAISDGWADWILCMPSDVHFEPDLVSRLLATGKEFVAAMFWTQEGDRLRFYDIWAFSRAGMNFGPYNFTWYQTHFPREVAEMDTVGGTILAKADLFRQGLRYSEVNLDRGLCEQVRAMGHTVWCDPSTHTIHL